MTPLLLAVPLALAAPVPKDFKTPPPLTGSWRMLSYDTGRGPHASNTTWTFTPGRAQFAANSFAELQPVPRARPAQFLMILVSGNRAAIYEIRGDTLTLSLSLSTEPPKTFDPGPKTCLYTFTRVK